MAESPIPAPASTVYCPPSQRVDADACRELLREVGAALWITPGDGVPSATLLPTTWRDDRLLAHASSHNEQFHIPEDVAVPCRVVIQGAHSYVSPRWYPSVQPPADGGEARGRAEGRAVGTWNYSQAQIAGWLRVHRDLERLRTEVLGQGHQVDAERFEPGSPPSDAHRGPWSPTEAPPQFLEPMLRGIIGLELEITEVVGRFKLSQNRTATDRAGVATGLRERGRPQDLAVADATDEATPLY